MSKIFKAILILVLVVFLGYLVLPNPDFPIPPPDSLQSKEPGDSETPLRRAYFTDYNREEVMVWYKKQLGKSVLTGIWLPTYRLNYPPEEAQTIIRDQTRSTFLEEVVHPFRESVFVNGFEPTNPKDAVIIEGRHFRQKIIIRYVPSSPAVRVVIFVLTVFFSVILFRYWKQAIGSVRTTKIKI
jgi:hypothetical protein